jgi:hypothetical protein
MPRPGGEPPRPVTGGDGLATSVLGAILLTGYVGGAVRAHLRVGDPICIPTAIGIFIRLGLNLRETRLKDLLTLRKA